jgi:ribosome-associated protein
MGFPSMEGEDLDPFLDEESLGPSKSSLKRESAALQALGEELLALPAHRLAQLELPEPLREAIEQGQSITAHGGLRRQRKFIGKLLRSLDADAIRAGLTQVKGGGVEQVRRLHQCERWRDRILSEGDPAVNDFKSDYPEADRQRLRQWVRDARREQDAGAPPRAARLLFRYLREQLSESASSAPLND